MVDGSGGAEDEEERRRSKRASMKKKAKAVAGFALELAIRMVLQQHH